MAQVNIRIDDEVKEKADALFEELGLNITTAFNIFVRQAIREGGLPFDVKLPVPNETTLKAMSEAKNNTLLQRFNNADEMFKALGVE